MKNNNKEDLLLDIEFYIMEVEGQGCYCLCYDDENGNRVVVDEDIEERFE
jgi:hypothetical protein